MTENWNTQWELKKGERIGFLKFFLFGIGMMLLFLKLALYILK